MKTYNYIYSDLSFDREDPFTRKSPTVSSYAVKKVNKYRKRVKRRKRITLFAVLLVIATITSLIIIKPAEVKNLVFQITSYDLVERSESESIEKNTLLQRHIKGWDSYSQSQRLQVAKELVEAELYELHVPYEVNVEIYDFDDEKMIAAMAIDSPFMSRKICIDPDYLEDCSANSIANTIAHETRHIYQFANFDLRQYYHEMFSGLLPSNEKWAWYTNFVFYTSDVKKERYRNQPVEADAFEYGDKREKYYQQLGLV